jgi:hypothetical protein
LAGAYAHSAFRRIFCHRREHGIATARGCRWLHDLAWWIAAFWRDGIAAVSAEAGTAIVPLVSSATFQTAFHVAVGLLMAIFYAFALEPILAGPAWLKGFVYAAGVWLLNAFVMLPAIGESIAGSRHLDLSGMIGFAVIHTVFFILLAVLYARLEARQAMRERPS